LGLAKFSHRSKDVLFLHMVGLPLHQVTLDLVGIFVWDFIFLPGLRKIGESQAIFCLKAAQRLVALSQLVLQAFFRQIFQFCFQVCSWGEVFEHPNEFIAERYGWHEFPRLAEA